MRRVLVYTLIFMLLLSISACRRNRRRSASTTRIERVSDRNTESALVGTNERRQTRDAIVKSVIKMRKERGVYHVPCKINGTEMEFIFDTGASDITISLTEAKFLFKQGKLVEDDFIGVQHFQTADGSIHEGITVIFRKVEIGNKILENIEASIMDNEKAPLLLGQSALAKFGKISIDYNRNEISFE